MYKLPRGVIYKPPCLCIKVLHFSRLDARVGNVPPLPGVLGCVRARFLRKSRACGGLAIPCDRNRLHYSIFLLELVLALRFSLYRKNVSVEIILPHIALS